MNKKELIRELSMRSMLTKKEAQLVINEMFNIITERAFDGDEVTIVGFGKFFLYEHQPRPVRNPKTQEEMILQSYKSLKFKSSNVIKNLLKNKSN